MINTNKHLKYKSKYNNLKNNNLNKTGGAYNYICNHKNYIHQLGHGSCWFDSILNIIFDSPILNKLIITKLLNQQYLIRDTSSTKYTSYKIILNILSSVFFEMNNIIHIIDNDAEFKYDMLLGLKNDFMSSLNKFRSFIYNEYDTKIDEQHLFINNNIQYLKNKDTVASFNKEYVCTTGIKAGNYPLPFFLNLLCSVTISFSYYKIYEKWDNLNVKSPIVYEPNPHLIIIDLINRSINEHCLPPHDHINISNILYNLCGLFFTASDQTTSHIFSVVNCNNVWNLYENNHEIKIVNSFGNYIKNEKYGLLSFPNYVLLKDNIENINIMQYSINNINRISLIFYKI
jgi:hypothetical protein